MAAYAYPSGYNMVLYRPKEFRKLAQKTARLLVRLMAHTGATAIAVRGKSGVAMGFAASMFAGLPIVTVRKPGESSHGETIEGPRIDLVRYLILDDFVSSGHTIRRIESELNEHADNLDEDRPVCVGVVEYHADSENRTWTLPSSGMVRVFNINRPSDWKGIKR